MKNNKSQLSEIECLVYEIPDSELSFAVRDGVLLLPMAMVHPLVALSAGNLITVIENAAYWRADDVAKELPDHAEDILKLAKKYNARTK